MNNSISNMPLNTVTNTPFFHVVAISVPVNNPKKPNYKISIVSTVYLKKFILSQKFLERMNKLELRKMILVIVSDAVTTDIGYLSKKYVDWELHAEVETRYVNPKRFFSLSGFNEIFGDVEQKGNNFEVIYIFKNMTWKQITYSFAITGLDISGGANNKKHSLSPNQFRLTQFLLCLLGSDTSEIVANSFHRTIKEDDKKKNNYSTVKSQEILLNLSLSNEELSAQIYNKESFIGGNLK